MQSDIFIGVTVVTTEASDVPPMFFDKIQDVTDPIEVVTATKEVSSGYGENAIKHKKYPLLMLCEKKTY